MLVLGSTSPQEIVQNLGEPHEKETVVVNGKSVEKIEYLYVNAPGEPLFDYVTASAGSQTFWFWKEKLVGHTFISSFRKDNTLVEEEKARQIHKGQTKEQVVEILGPPHGKKIYPFTEGRDSDIYYYGYAHSSYAKREGFYKSDVKLRRYVIKVDVYFNDEGKVSSVDLSAEGFKPY